jgi:hypothetical protein
MTPPNSFLLALCFALAIALIAIWLPEHYASFDFYNILIGVIGIAIAVILVWYIQWWRFEDLAEFLKHLDDDD